MLKRRLKGKMLAPLIILLMMVCVSAFAGLRDESWSVNPSDFRYDMSLYFRMENKDFEDLSLFEIGAFVDDECRGVAEKLELSQGESCLYMRIRSNKAQGEQLSFYMKDKVTGQIVHVRGEDGSSITFKADSRIGLPSDPFVMTPFYTVVFKIDGEVYKTLEVGYGDPIAAPEVPEKEGYTFNGWGDIPATMPAHDIEMHSSYSVNYYKLTFMAGEEEIFSGDIAYGSDIIVPSVPEKDGQVFSWDSEIPQTMPANDLVISGSYEVLNYNVVFKIDGETVHTEQVPYGEVIPVFNDVPVKEGYSFSGWSPIPETMPARDVEINGTYEINRYTITFSIGDEVFVSESLAFGEEVIVPEAPAREGHTFNGWGDVPAVMPARDLSFKGDYTVNSYTVIFRIDQEVFKTFTLEYGASIEVPEAPEMVGHTFSGWGDVPATMPAYDLVFVGTFEDIYYTITFRIGDEIIKMADLPYEAEIILPEVPEKEGHSFGGWGDVPATMPASNIEIVGSYTPNKYVLKFQIDDYVIFMEEVLYGSEIVAPEAPEKEGNTFSGWGVVPATMPASDLVISGTYTPNIYTLTFFIDGAIFYTTQVPYGSEINAPEPPFKEGYTLVGWTDVPATMPAYDLNLDASYSVNSYNLTFKIGDEEIFSGPVQYGAEIVAPEVPAKEGHTFSGWGMVPSTMPANDLEITGSYEVNIYNLSFMVDGEPFYITTLAYGSEIVAPVVPEVEGKTFSGWGEVPSTMPANDLFINGTYAVNYYLLTFKIGDEIVFSGEVAYGAEISSPTAPEKEGHTFVGWGDVPSTMPASPLVFEGSYSVNSYSLTFKVGDEVLSEATVPYGSEIVIPDVPEKEGYSFSGWGVVPSVMPASDLVITGSYEVNSYNLVFKIGDEVFYSAQLPYGSEIAVPEVPVREGYTFSGWGDVPTTMPAKDLEFSGFYEENIYKLVFKIDGEVVSSSEVLFGSIINFPEVKEKEGYTFSGWGVVPYIMPAHDLEISGTYEVNYYNLIFKIDGEVVYSSSVAYGSEITVPASPEREGYTFSGWTDVPEVMPAEDLEFNSSYTVNVYKAVFTIDGEVIATLEVPYGSVINTPDAPEKEGYTFAGWLDVPETMPASDLEISGTYDVNYYNLTFKIDGEVVSSSSVAYGSEISVPEAPEREGYTFSGWTDVPEVMPAEDLEFNSTYTANVYKAVFTIDGEVIATLEVPYGSVINTPDAPEKEGYTFAGWLDVPETMPASDINISGSYTVNTYHLTVYLNNDIYMEEDLDYGAAIVIPDPELGPGLVFDGWTEEIPATMPAHDVEIHGVVKEVSAVGAMVDEGDTVTVITIDGLVIYKDAKASDVKDRLTPGIYIVNGKKTVIR